MYKVPTPSPLPQRKTISNLQSTTNVSKIHISNWSELRFYTMTFMSYTLNISGEIMCFHQICVHPVSEGEKPLFSFFSLIQTFHRILTYVMQSSKMSLKSKCFNFCFMTFSIRVLFKLEFGENPMKIGQSVLEK